MTASPIPDVPPNAPPSDVKKPVADRPATAPLDFKQLLETRGDDEAKLFAEHVNPSLSKVLKTLGYHVHYTHGRGAHLFDEDGNTYIDCLGGFGTFAVGRNHPTVREGLKQVMDLDLPSLPKFGVPRLSGLLAERLLAVAPGDLEMVYFCNSGAEGVETAMKYARAATGRQRIVYCNKAYHGLTYGALSLNGGVEFRERFGNMMDDCTQIPFNDLAAVERELSKGDVAGFIVEPIQGKGVFVADDDYLPGVAELCRKHGAVFALDEVQTGYGRTGKMFACEHWNVEPDILITAKALSGGYVPVAAVMSKRWIHDKVFGSMDRCMVHSTTFSQNDLAMAAGLLALQVIQEERLIENTAAMGDRLKSRFEALQDQHEMVAEVRGKGLMLAIEFGPPKGLKLKMGWSLLHKLDQSLFPQAMLIPLLQDHRILAQVAGHNMDVIKFLPPLVVNEQDINAIADGVEAVVAACHKFPGPVWEVGKRLTAAVVR